MHTHGRTMCTHFLCLGRHLLSEGGCVSPSPSPRAGWGSGRRDGDEGSARHFRRKLPGTALPQGPRKWAEVPQGSLLPLRPPQPTPQLQARCERECQAPAAFCPSQKKQWLQEPCWGQGGWGQAGVWSCKSGAAGPRGLSHKGRDDGSRARPEQGGLNTAGMYQPATQQTRFP